MSLFTRVIGVGGEDVRKIGLHSIQSCMSEISSGRMTVSRAVEIIGLDENESTDFQTVLVKAGQANNPLAFSDRVFRYLLLGEQGVAEYQDETAFWDMLDAEVLR